MDFMVKLSELFQIALNHIMTLLGVALGTLVFSCRIRIRGFLRIAKDKILEMLGEKDGKKSLQVIQLLTELRMLSGSERSYIYTLSTDDKIGGDVRKFIMKCPYQSLKEGVSSIIPLEPEKFSSKSTNLFNEMVDGPIHMQITDINDEYIKSLFYNQGMKHSIYVPIIKDENSFLGILCLSYNKDEIESNELEFIMETLTIYVLKLKFELGRKY